MNTEKPFGNIQYLDTLRALATIAVVVIHVDTPVMNMNYARNMDFWWVGLIIDNMVRFAVPLFLVLSGATLLTKQYSLIDFYKKRMSRVLIPFLFWLPAYWVFRWFMLQAWERPRDIYSILQWGADLFVAEGVSKHLWFVYMILLLYLFVPFIAGLLKKASRRNVLIFLISWLVLNGLQLSGVFAVDSFGLIIKKLYSYSLYAGYLVLGYFLFTSTVRFKAEKLLAVLIFVISVIVASVSTYYLSRQCGKQTLTMMNSFSLNTFLQTVAVFVFFKNTYFKNKIVLKIIRTISNYSFGIYLVHIMVISLFFRVGIFWTMAHPLVSVPFVVLLTLLTSFSVIYLLRKIPFMAKFAG